jgi:hypothetical protein
MKNLELHIAIFFVFMYMKADKRIFKENPTCNEIEHTY